MSDKPSMDKDRRNWLIATSAVGGVGAAAAFYPFIDSFEPSERAVEWRGKPVWVVRRTPEQVAELSKIDSELADPDSLRDPAQFTPPYAQNQWRSIKPEYLVVVGICTHLGCSHPLNLRQAHSLPCRIPGLEASYAHATVLHLIWRVAYLRTNQPQITLKYRHICI